MCCSVVEFHKVKSLASNRLTLALNLADYTHLIWWSPISTKYQWLGTIVIQIIDNCVSRRVTIKQRNLWLYLIIWWKRTLAPLKRVRFSANDIVRDNIVAIFLLRRQWTAAECQFASQDRVPVSSSCPHFLTRPLSAHTIELWILYLLYLTHRAAFFYPFVHDVSTTAESKDRTQRAHRSNITNSRNLRISKQ